MYESNLARSIWANGKILTSITTCDERSALKERDRAREALGVVKDGCKAVRFDYGYAMYFGWYYYDKYGYACYDMIVDYGNKFTYIQKRLIGGNNDVK